MDKEKVWQKALATTSQITDKTGMAVDSKVLDIVTAMRLHGFRTTASCEGHVDRVNSGPFVKFESLEAVQCFKEAEALREQLIIDGKYKDKINEGRLHTWQEMRRMHNMVEAFKKADTHPDNTLLTVQYVMNKHIFLQCYGVEFSHLYGAKDRQEILLRYQKVMHSFSDYLKNVYFV